MISIKPSLTAASIVVIFIVVLAAWSCQPEPRTARDFTNICERAGQEIRPIVDNYRRQGLAREHALRLAIIDIAHARDMNPKAMSNILEPCREAFTTN